MFVVGERINGMFTAVKKGIQEKDKKAIQDLAQAQLNAGANALDINVGPATADAEGAMKWLVETVREVTDAPLAIDTTKLKVLEIGLQAAGEGAIINSTTGHEEKLNAILPLAAKYKAQVVGLCMDEKGIPRDADGRAEIALRTLAAAMEAGITPDNLYIDPVILPCNVDQAQCGHVLDTIRQMRVLSDPPPKTLLGLSNVSQGTKKRELINRTYLVMALANGLDAAIMDPLDTELMDAGITAGLLLNQYIYCDSFLQAYRKT